jgi:hypothetical protein
LLSLAENEVGQDEPGGALHLWQRCRTRLSWRGT